MTLWIPFADLGQLQLITAALFTVTAELNLYYWFVSCPVVHTAQSGYRPTLLVLCKLSLFLYYIHPYI